MSRTLVRVVALAGVAGVLLFLVSGCGTATDPWQGEEGKLRVVVSIPPVASWVRAVGGDRVAIRCLCTATGPHHYQTDTREARLLTKAQLLLAIGLRLDDSFTDAMRTLVRRTDLPFIKLGAKLPSAMLMELKHSHDPNIETDHAHKHGKWDPHVWLGLAEAVAMVDEVANQLAIADEANAAEYKKNAAAYTARLKALHEEGKRQIAEATRPRRLISFHEALGYFARSFGLEIADVIEQGPGDEPTGAVAKIVERCRDTANPIGAITVEPQYSKSSSASTIQKELKAKGIQMPLVEIDPLETANETELTAEGGDWYLKRMRDNLSALAKTLR